MASTSASRAGGAAGRIRTAATTISSDNQTLIADIRRALGMMREIAVDLERENQSEMVKELENAAVDLVQGFEDSNNFSYALQSIGDRYQPGPELTNFDKLIEDEVAKVKSRSPFVAQNHNLVRHFREAVWNVHHSGQPLPGEEHEDIVMTSTQGNLLNTHCPISGKPVTELEEPVRSMDCKHIYEKNAIMHMFKSRATIECPVAACPRRLELGKVVSDPLLRVEIEELRSLSKQTVGTNVIEDFTELDDEDTN